MIIFVILNVYLSYQIFGLPVSTFKAGYRYMEDCSAYVSVDGWDVIGTKVQRFRVVQQPSGSVTPQNLLMETRAGRTREQQLTNFAVCQVQVV